PVFEPVLKLNSSYTEWQGHIHQAIPNEPVMVILDGNADPISWNIEPAGGIIMGEWPWIIFDQSGVLGNVNLNLDPDLRTRNISQQIGSTENVSLRATIR